MPPDRPPGVSRFGPSVATVCAKPADVPAISVSREINQGPIATPSRDGHVEVAKAYYSAPAEYLGRRVWVRWDGRTMRIFNQRFEQIALHVRHEPGRFSTLGEHLAAEKIGGIERGSAWLLSKIRLVGPHTTDWAQTMIKSRGITGVRSVARATVTDQATCSRRRRTGLRGGSVLRRVSPAAATAVDSTPRSQTAVAPLPGRTPDYSAVDRLWPVVAGRLGRHWREGTRPLPSPDHR